MARGELIVVVDTCVLMKAGLIEFLVKVHHLRGCTLRWSEGIRSEFERRIGRRPDRAQARCREALGTIRDALVPVGDEDLATASDLVSDPDDAMVAAAALGAVRLLMADAERWEGAEVVLLTDNTPHFDGEGLAFQGATLLGCDDLGCLLLDRDETLVVSIVDPAREPGRLLGKLRRDGLDETARRVERLLDEQGLL